MTVPRKRPLECPIEQCIAVVSGRWKAMILWRLLAEPQRYTALHGQMKGLSQRALSQALAELARDGVIDRRDDLWAPTALGDAIRPALLAMFSWGLLHQQVQNAAPLPRAAPTEPSLFKA